MGEPARRRRRWPWVAGAAGAAVLVFVLVWFQPQKLVLDDKVSDNSPAASSKELAGGQFVSLDHGTRGKVRIVEGDDGGRVVRLEGLDTSNGPDLFVYLSTTGAKGEESTFDDDFVSLGRLKGNKGDQNYAVPANVDLSRFTSVVIWCDRFNSAFGAADLVRA